MASACGMSGIGGGGVVRPVQLLRAGRAARGGIPQYRPVHERHARLQHRLEQLRTVRAGRVAPERAERLHAGAARRSRAGDAARRLLRRLRAAGDGVFLDVFGANPGSSISLTATIAAAGLGRTDGRSFSVRGTGCRPGRSPRRRCIRSRSDAQPRRRHVCVRAGDQDRPGAHVDVGFQRSITRDMAIEARYVGTYGRDQWSKLDYNAIRGENLITQQFHERVQAGDAEPAGEQRLRRFVARWVDCVLRAGYRHQPAADLPRLFEREQD